MQDILDAKKWVIEARAALGVMDAGEFYRIRISCPAHLHNRKQAISEALFKLQDALILLQSDLEEEIDDERV